MFIILLPILNLVKCNLVFNLSYMVKLDCMLKLCISKATQMSKFGFAELPVGNGEGRVAHHSTFLLKK